MAPMSTPANLTAIRTRLRAHADPARAAAVSRYFKTAPGEYGAGDRFMGATMPQIRALAREGQHLRAVDVSRLLDSVWHEERMLGVVILVRQFARADDQHRARICALYLRKRRGINNWDLVDVSAGQILGPYLQTPRGARIRALGRSRNVWDRRMAIIATAHEIRHGRYAATFDAVEGLMHDRHDLIHKACGWMLREVGKRDGVAARRFLDRHAATMPRTMLRYAIERFPEAERRRYRSRRASD